jgi:hypothetical protein
MLYVTYKNYKLRNVAAGCSCLPCDGEFFLKKKVATVETSSDNHFLTFFFSFIFLTLNHFILFK